jgi:hypothetical protein
MQILARDAAKNRTEQMAVSRAKKAILASVGHRCKGLFQLFREVAHSCRMSRQTSAEPVARL